MIDDGLLHTLTTQAATEGIQRLIVGAVVPCDAGVLLLKRPEGDFMGGIFELPSGKVEHGESLTEALAREVHEESGLIVTDIRGYLGSFDYISGSGKKSRQFNFAVNVDRTEPVELSEHDAFLWAAPTGDLPVTDSVERIIQAYRRTFS